MKLIKMRGIFILIIALFISLSACRNNSWETSNDDYTEVKENVNDSGYDSETENSELALSCDVILSSGQDEEGNYYELVANEKEDYEGTKTKIGAIKNGKWSVNLTSDNCFIEDGGLLVDDKSVKENDAFRYIGHGCFYYQNIIFNADNNLSFLGSPYRDEGYLAVFAVGIETNFDYYDGLMPNVKRNHNEYLDSDTIMNEEGKYLLFNENDFYLLDANTMKKTKIGLTVPGGGYGCTVYPYSENLIGVRSVFSGGIANSDSDGFYDVNGKRVIDLSKYDTDTAEPSGFYFINGESTFEINNDQDKSYFITIDNKGKVINSEEVEEDYENEEE